MPRPWPGSSSISSPGARPTVEGPASVCPLARDRSAGSRWVVPSPTVLLAGRPVHRVGFGAMQLPGPGVFGPPPDRDAALAVLRRAVAAGVDHIDTAQFYGPDVANDLIHAALHPYPDSLV